MCFVYPIGNGSSQSFIDYNCPCNVRYGLSMRIKLHGSNHGDNVKPRPQFCKWRG